MRLEIEVVEDDESIRVQISRIAPEDTTGRERKIAQAIIDAVNSIAIVGIAEAMRTQCIKEV